MIPKELQDKLDSLNKDFREHCKNSMKALEKKLKTQCEVIDRINDNYKENSFYPMHESEWVIVYRLIDEMSQIIDKLWNKSGERCIECQGWIEEKLKSK